ncbi:MAG: membrane protein insertase YidC [Elusimicrobiota bacterium]|jgi:YidC/Oxa1 family membrane protein insertase|nr:membrane protein insertase YidC [Elusimicrobiota bacterium]
MNKNTLLFVVMSAAVIFGWYFLFPPEPSTQNDQTPIQEEVAQTPAQAPAAQTPAAQTPIPQNQTVNATNENTQNVFIENEKEKIVLTNKGAGISSWQIKEQDGNWIELVENKSEPVLANSDGNYRLVSQSADGAVFELVSPEGWKITKTYQFTKDSYMNELNIKLETLRQGAALPAIDIIWGPGLGTDDENMKENLSVTRVVAYTAQKPSKLEVFKNTRNENADLYQWAAIDNRYFLVAFIPKNNADFSTVSSYREDKKHPFYLTLGLKPQTDTSKDYSLSFYVGPKGYSYLQTYNIKLEEAVDFGFFGFLGKFAFRILNYLKNITGNFGWAIIILTIIIQIIISPLTFKSYKSMAAMKKIQPLIKDIQTRYKEDKSRLQAEMMNVYKTYKVNPMGGCLPMLCQLPIFWAFFTMLRNAYELRGSQWILWVNDLSTSDNLFAVMGFNVHMLPLIMGAGMFLQQKMSTASSDPTQKKMMYILPIVFTFMFWGFPSGLVLYWLTNSICSMIGQSIISRRDKVVIKKV